MIARNSFFPCREGSVFVNFTIEFRSVTGFPLAELQQHTSDGKLGEFKVVENSLSLSSEGILLFLCNVVSRPTIHI